MDTILRVLGLSTALLCGACSKSTSTSLTGTDASTSMSVGSANVVCDEAATLAAIDAIGKRSFSDNPTVTWKVVGSKASGSVRYVEVEPSRDEVGYPRFVFAVGCDASAAPELHGIYALEKGGVYALLSTSNGRTLPDAPP